MHQITGWKKLRQCRRKWEGGGEGTAKYLRQKQGNLVGSFLLDMT